MNAKSRADDQLPMSQYDPKDRKEKKETQGSKEEKYMGEIEILSKSKKNQNQVCGYDNCVVQEVSPDRTNSRQELSDQNLVTENQEEPTDENQRSDIVSSSQERSRNREIYTVAFPKEETFIQGQFLSDGSAEEKQVLSPSLGRGTADDVASGKVWAPTPTKTAGSHVSGKPLSARGTEERKMGKDNCRPCSKCKANEAARLLPTAKYPNPQDTRAQPPQDEICTQSSASEDDYDYIEEFLGEGALVNIDSAQTYVDLQNGAVRTSIEVSAEDEGVAVKHEVEWVTQFVRPAKAK